MGVPYATTNPAVAAFNEGMKAGGDRRAADVKLLQETLGYEENMQSAPSRISRARADARIANTAADVADSTKGANIKIAYNSADRGTLQNQDLSVDLGEKRATSDGRVASQNTGFGETVATSPSRVRSTIATNDANTETAPVEAGVKVQTAPYRVQQSQQQAQTGAVNVTEQQLKFFKESVKLIEEGRIAEAEEIARRTGEKIPDEVKNNASLRGVMKSAIEDAERLFPNRPNAQFKRIKEVMDSARATGIGQRGPENTVTTPSSQPISETGSPKNATAMDQNIDSLIRRGIAKDDKEAFALINQQKTDPQATLQRLYEAERKVRLDAAKGPGGFTTITNTDIERIDREATAAAGQKAQQLKQMAATMPALPPGSVPAVAAAPTPGAPPPPAAPAAPPPPAAGQETGWFRRPLFGGGQPAPAAPAPPQPVSKEQGRLPDGAPPALDPAIQQRAQGMNPDDVRRQAAAAIAAGKDRNAVIGRLKALGVPTEGL